MWAGDHRSNDYHHYWYCYYSIHQYAINLIHNHATFHIFKTLQSIDDVSFGLLWQEHFYKYEYCSYAQFVHPVIKECFPQLPCCATEMQFQLFLSISLGYMVMLHQFYECIWNYTMYMSQWYNNIHLFVDQFVFACKCALKVMPRNQPNNILIVLNTNEMICENSIINFHTHTNL